MGIMRFFGLGDSATDNTGADETILEGAGDEQNEVVPVITMGSDIKRQKRRVAMTQPSAPATSLYPPDVAVHPINETLPQNEGSLTSGLSVVNVGPVASLKDFQPVDPFETPAQDHPNKSLARAGRLEQNFSRVPYTLTPHESQGGEHPQKSTAEPRGTAPPDTIEAVAVTPAPQSDLPEEILDARVPQEDLSTTTLPQTSSGGSDLSDLRHRVLLASIQAPAPAKHLPKLPPDVRPSAPKTVSPLEVMPNMRQPTKPVVSPPAEEATVWPETPHEPPPVLAEAPTTLESTTMAPTQPPSPSPRPMLSAVRTFASDVTSTMVDKHVSVVRAIAAEEKRQQEMARAGYEPTYEARSSARLYYLLGISSMLVVIGCAALVYLFMFHKTPLDVAVEFAATGYFTPDEKESIDVTGKNRSDIIDRLTTSRDQVKVRTGGVTQLVLTTTIVTGEGEPIVSIVPSKDFLNILGARIPNELAQTLTGTPMVGVYEGSSNTLFIVLTVRDFNTAFDAMLKWESGLIFDVGPLFGRNAGTINVVSDTTRAHVPVEKASSTATSTGATSTNAIALTSPAKPSEMPSGPTYTYTGRIIANKETRVLENTNDRSVALLWSFVDKSHLVIAPNDSTFIEVQRRLLNAQ